MSGGIGNGHEPVCPSVSQRTCSCCGPRRGRAWRCTRSSAPSGGRTQPPRNRQPSPSLRPPAESLLSHLGLLWAPVFVPDSVTLTVLCLPLCVCLSVLVFSSHSQQALSPALPLEPAYLPTRDSHPGLTVPVSARQRCVPGLCRLCVSCGRHLGGLQRAFCPP